MMLKKLFLFVLVCVFVSNATDGIVSRAWGSPVASKPTFYDEQNIRPRDWAAQNPVFLEGSIDSSYMVGPGDFFEILLPGNHESSQVSPEGSIATQCCGLVEVSGLPLHEAKQRILEKLKTRYDQRYVGVHLVQMRNFLVNVQGAVVNPGQIIVSPQSRVSEAAYRAGGYKPTANKDTAYIHRKGNKIVTAEDIFLEFGDIIEVPHKDWYQTISLINSEKITTVSYVPGKTLKEYLREANLKIVSGYTSVSVKYPPPNEQLNATNFIRWIGVDQVDSFVPDPMCEIEFHMQAPFVYVGGAVAVVGRVPYNPAMYPADYVAASGVTVITGKLSRVSVLRNGKKVSVDWASGEILPGDFIEIPRTVYEQVKDFTLFLASVIGIAASAITIWSLSN